MSALRLQVGVHGGGFNGIDTYAEQVAIAAALAGLQVTLLASDREVADRLRARVTTRGVAVEDLGLTPLSPRAAWIERLWPTATLRRMLTGLRLFAARSGGKSVWHFNRPALALAVKGRAERICVAGWFYPHRALGRLQETWRHVGGSLLRRTVIAAKAMDFYRWDQAGYRAADWVVAPTKQLAIQLQAQGHRSLACPPPASVPLDVPPRDRPIQPMRFLVCSGDLAHPRKNLFEAVEALGALPVGYGPITLTAVGRNPEPLQRFASQRAPRLRVDPLGLLEPARVRAEMQACDALLFPSRYEEWGYVAVESLLCGTPVVTYPVYPFGEMLSRGLGEVARGLGPSNFAAAIERSLSLPRGRELSHAAAARYGAATVGQLLRRIWQGDPPATLSA